MYVATGLLIAWAGATLERSADTAMSRSLEDILFAAPSPQARITTRWQRHGRGHAVGAGSGHRASVPFAGQLDAPFWEFFAWPTTWTFLAKGLLGTLASSAMAAVIALALGLVLLLGRLSRLRLVRWPSIAVIEFLRGTPTLLLIYVCFLVLPSVGIKLSTYWMLTLPIGLSTAAVVAEVYRAGVLAVPRGQTDAARSLG
jgi:glutamate transport system permease protein